MKKRPLTEEEKHLWEHIKRDTKPLPDSGRMAENEKQKPVFISSPSLPSFPVTCSQSPTTPLAPGHYANIDRNTADRFRKGKYPIDGTIDLHGMSREKAHIALSGFIRSHYERGSRCLLAITGKGVRKDMQADATQGIVRGVLREMLPQWLDEPGLRPMVLAFDSAKQEHGGSGAYYILLRRKRG